ncbi:hypothetical protein Lesp02_13420 [Lentzea sp. NBRC 105346]|uniref:hypothetical protein n=1 Tax=Lentzea sp. NBRC 105346 TaxID=3032205 RepID=UPI0024A26F43|nr:hypothetical protein [Lentzea sp. NBRC 105346]GLZ29152.1 hypothetical protein Lesp02_13420 [Lentzea sp. NBRC 105346]
MSDTGVEQLVAELKALRRGFGVQSRDISTRIGPALRHVCGLSAEDSQPEQREKVISMLTTVIDELPLNLADMAKDVFGLAGTADVRYEERMARRAKAVDRDTRTVRRYVDDVLVRIAETALHSRSRRPFTRPAENEHPWHTAELTTIVLLDPAITEVFEERRVVSRISDLASVDYSMTITEDGPLDVATLGITVLRGACLDFPERVGSNRLTFQLRLPRPLAVHEEHVISLRMRIPRPFAPHYVCTPKRPCDRFTLIMRFPGDHVPNRVWQLEDEFPLELSDPLLDRIPLTVDAIGEVTASFTDLALNRSYGIGWEARRCDAL